MNREQGKYHATYTNCKYEYYIYIYIYIYMK